jgi:hypothetical protein
LLVIRDDFALSFIKKHFRTDSGVLFEVSLVEAFEQFPVFEFKFPKEPKGHIN